MSHLASSDQMRLQPARLYALADAWRQQEWDLKSAQRSLSGSDCSGVSPAVAVDVADFLAAWADAIGELAHDVQRMADGVAATVVVLAHLDDEVGNAWS